MAQNRKRESLQLSLVAKLLLTCLYIATVGLGYVWNKNQIYRLGDDLRKHEVELATIEKRNALLAAQLAQLKSPARLEQQNQQLRFGLVTPRESQIVRLPEPGAEWNRTVAELNRPPAVVAPPAPKPRMVARR
jgi:cell division protein FtsB